MVDETVCFSVSDGLYQYGVHVLTGEACALSLRALCDLTEDGVQLVADFVGAKRLDKSSLHENYNSKVGGEPAVASVTLAWDALPSLLALALARAGYAEAIIDKWAGAVHATKSPFEVEWQERKRMLHEAMGDKSFLLRIVRLQAESHNLHVMWGRRMGPEPKLDFGIDGG